ncbi:unnamed protein product [Angiostrongylus costaricensis]|uniref:Reverse transcriptase domain-containing protein n=1 Tax=Angiostrongylus costaricensis TaxID=334426 RepID=A0A0R3PK66_ANGCS|nr:unnamed protein product [Angiostrongylus costaricensis]
MDYIQTITIVIEVSREYKRSFRFTFIDLKKGFEPVKIEVVMEAQDSQGVPNQYIMIIRELYKNFAAEILPLYNDINTNVKRRVGQGDPSRQNYLPLPSRMSCELWYGITWERKSKVGSYIIFALLMISFL